MITALIFLLCAFVLAFAFWGACVMFDLELLENIASKILYSVLIILLIVMLIMVVYLIWMKGGAE